MLAGSVNGVVRRACAGAIMLAGLMGHGAQAAEESRYRIVGYYPSWAAYRGVYPDSIRAELTTHLNYAFAKPTENGRIALGDQCADIGRCGAHAAIREGGNFAQLVALKERFPRLKVLLSVGGWSSSAHFSDAALTPAARQRFADSAVALLRRFALFDGVDLDWEYPVAGGRPENTARAEDKRNFTLLLQTLRQRLDAVAEQDGRPYLLTIAGPAGIDKLNNMELEEIHPQVDWINVMSYDYHTGGKAAHFNAPLHAAAGDPTPHLTVAATVAAYLARGAPRQKLSLGLAFFGYGYGGVGPERNGLFAAAERNGLEPRAGDDTEWGIGLLRFDELSGSEARGFKRFWHEEAKAPFLFNAQRGVWISYDDAQSLREKVRFARAQQLGGVMVWELTGDDGTLLPAVSQELRND